MLNFSNFGELFLLGVFGSFVMEIFKLYELRGKLHFKKYQKIYKSFLFWVVSLLFLLTTGLLTWVIYESKTNIEAWQVVLTGMGLSSINKKILESFASQKTLDAGCDEDITLRDIIT